MKIVHNFCLPYIFHVCRNGISSFKFLNIKGKEMISALSNAECGFCKYCVNCELVLDKNYFI